MPAFAISAKSNNAPVLMPSGSRRSENGYRTRSRHAMNERSSPNPRKSAWKEWACPFTVPGSTATLPQSSSSCSGKVSVSSVGSPVARIRPPCTTKPCRVRHWSWANTISAVTIVTAISSRNGSDGEAWSLLQISPPPRLRGRELGLLLDEADLPRRLEDGPSDLIERLDLVLPGLLGDVIGGQALAAQVLLDEPAVLDDHHGLALQDGAQPAEPEAQV